MSLLALVVALAAPAQVATPAPAQAAAVDSARKARGVELARLLNNEAMGRAQLDQMLTATFPAALAADPTFKALEKDHPGISKAMIDAMRPILSDQVIGTLPQLWDSLGTIYAEELTAAELDEALAFFRTPTGTRVIDSMAREVDLGAEMRAMLAGGSTEISEASLRSSLAKGAVNTVRKLSDEDRKAINAFGWTPAGAKLNATKPRVLQVMTAWSNAASPEADARMDKAMDEVVEKFVGKASEQ